MSIATDRSWHFSSLFNSPQCVVLVHHDIETCVHELLVRVSRSRVWVAPMSRPVRILDLLFLTVPEIDGAESPPSIWVKLSVSFLVGSLGSDRVESTFLRERGLIDETRPMVMGDVRKDVLSKTLVYGSFLGKPVFSFGVEKQRRRSHFFSSFFSPFVHA